MKTQKLRSFLFILFINTFEVGRKEIVSNSYDNALKQFNRLDLPFHHHSTVKCLGFV